MRPLTDKQEMFAIEYLKDRNATQAAIRAGYSPKTAYSQGPDLLKKPGIRAIIDKRTEEVLHSSSVTADWVTAQLVDIALNGDRDSARVRALELLGRSLGIFVERHEIKHQGVVYTLTMDRDLDGD